MHVGEREEILRYRRLVGLLDTWEGEGAGDEEAGGGIPFRRGSVRVERAAVVFGRAELVSGFHVSWLLGMRQPRGSSA